MAIRAVGISMAGALALPLAADAADAEAGLADLSLEELGQIEVTSVSKRKERLLDAPASIYVITHEEIRRSGYTSLADALRLAPNLQIAQINAAQYAITSRGFNNANALANKLLVLIDGRTVYSPVYSGVFWDQQDVLLEDVDRIEVISGPGGTLWGANAVNGVINVITRSAQDTKGGFVTLGAGDAKYGGAFRYGAALGDSGAIRLYAKSTELQNTKLENGDSVLDGWQLHQAGFRTDWGHSQRNFTFQGDFYEGKSDVRGGLGPIRVNGANLLGRWTEQFDSGADLQVQAYIDRSQREDQAFFQGDADTYDIEFQNGIPLGSHKLLWGGGYREAHDNVPPTTAPFGIINFITTFDPQKRTLRWENVFVQDEFNLTRTVRLTAGVKFESNDYTGWETLPSARIAWSPDDAKLIWLSASRAVRAPARLDRDFHLAIVAPTLPPPFNTPAQLILGGPDFISEVANVYELGYRAQPTSQLTFSATAFYHDYDKLRSGQVAPAFIQNRNEGSVSGVEAWIAYQATDAWRLSGGLVELSKDLQTEPGANDPAGTTALGNDPDHQWMLRSSLNLTPRLELDLMVRSVSRLPNAVAVPAYTAVDARLGWRPERHLDLFVAVQNLFDPGHVEFGTATNSRSEIPRAFFAGVAWRM